MDGIPNPTAGLESADSRGDRNAATRRLIERHAVSLDSQAATHEEAGRELRAQAQALFEVCAALDAR